jgi:putative flippase GtrA
MTSLLYIYVGFDVKCALHQKEIAMNLALRRYTLSCAALMLVYSILVVLISWVLDLPAMPYALRMLLAASPALPLLAMLYVFDRYLRSEPDEFLRFLLSRAAMLAGGVVVGLFSAWGFLEQYAAWPRFPAILAFPLFWAAYGVAVVLLRQRFA